MKTIVFEGKKYEVKNWVNFVARDIDGTITGFELKPNFYDVGWEEDSGRSMDIFRPAFYDATESLIEV
jgi:hypothetical protein